MDQGANLARKGKDILLTAPLRPYPQRKTLFLCKYMGEIYGVQAKTSIHATLSMVFANTGLSILFKHNQLWELITPQSSERVPHYFIVKQLCYTCFSQIQQTFRYL